MMNKSGVKAIGNLLWAAFRFYFRPEKAFAACGLVGLAVALPFSMAIAAHAGLSPIPIAVIGLVSFGTLLGMGMLSKILTGTEKLAYYRDVMVIFLVDSALSWLFRESVLRYLEIVVLGVAMFLAFGRVGCLLVGCCHGRPSSWGIRYSQSHADCGFPSHYVGVRLFPIQAVESLFVFCLVVVGTRMAWVGAKPGTVFSFYIFWYAVGRSFIEFARGDAGRRHFWNFSEPQWTSTLLLWAVVFAEQRNVLPLIRWHLPAALALTACMVSIAVAIRFDPVKRFQICHPHHLRDLAVAIRNLPSSRTAEGAVAGVTDSSRSITLLTTSWGIALSGGTIDEYGRLLQNYCVSRPRKPLTLRQARVLAHAIGGLQVPRQNFRMYTNAPGIFHLLTGLRQSESGETSRETVFKKIIRLNYPSAHT
jgi:prolipoprotein diacylglyceryl transferase